MKNNISLIYFALVLSIMSLTSCGYIKVIRLKNATEPPIKNYESNSKQVRFIGIAHVAKPELYKSIKEEIIKAKKEGYVLFWEFIDFNDANDTELRKVRKMVGFVPSLENYARKSQEDLEEGYAVQDNAMFLGLVNDKDFNTDLTPTELVAAYEKMYGEIVLTQADMDLPIEKDTYETVPPFNMLNIVKNYRNDYLAGEIEKSKYNKIVVLYGALHQNGFLSSLKTVNESWKKSRKKK